MPLRASPLSLVLLCVSLGLAAAPLARAASDSAARQKLFVIAHGAAHKRALMASVQPGSIRMEFESPGNARIFSGEFSEAELQVLSRLGARFEPVEEIFPLVRRAHPGRLARTSDRAHPLAPGKPACGDGRCHGHENADSCPADCVAEGAGRGHGPRSSRACLPLDQEDYPTLLSNGQVPLSAGAGVRLFVIDTGTTPSHPDLDVAVCRDVTGRRARNGCDDAEGHGTHTSGSAAASGGADGLGLIGAAPGASLGVIKICGTSCFSDALVRGIEEAVKQKADVISLSFAASDSQALHNAVRDAVANGVLFLASAGNSGPAPNSIVYPAAYPEVVAVGMLDPAGILSPISSRGVDDGDDSVVSSRELELVAGGFLVESTWLDGCYQVLSGTSMATPTVAGLAAANWQGDAESTRAWLVAVAQDLDNASRVPEVDPSSSGFDAVSGYGLPRTAAGTDGGSAASVTSSPSEGFQGEEVLLDVTGPPDASYRIGVTSPSGQWAWGQFSTDGAGRDQIRLDPWNDPGSWLISVDFGNGAGSFDADWAVYRQR